MAIIKQPAGIQPAFNEITFLNDSDEFLNVSGKLPSPNRSIALRHVKVYDDTIGASVARFDVRAFVSRLFKRSRISAPLYGASEFNVPWCFEDLMLKAYYTAYGSTYVALNAVRQIGESLDLMASDTSPVLTACESIGGSFSSPEVPGNFRVELSMPAYDGFPVGVTVMHTNTYDDQAGRVETIAGQVLAGDNTTVGTYLKS